MKVNDRFSAIFVIVSVAVFVGILLWGLLGGQSGLLSNALATPAR